MSANDPIKASLDAIRWRLDGIVRELRWLREQQAEPRPHRQATRLLLRPLAKAKPPKPPETA